MSRRPSKGEAEGPAPVLNARLSCGEGGGQAHLLQQRQLGSIHLGAIPGRLVQYRQLPGRWLPLPPP